MKTYSTNFTGTMEVTFLKERFLLINLVSVSPNGANEK